MIQYTSVDRVLSMLQREVGIDEYNESDLIEWIGEAVGFLNVRPILEEVVLIDKVKDNRIEVPNDLVYIQQLYRVNNEDVLANIIGDVKPLPDTDSTFMLSVNVVHNYCEDKNSISPVRLSNNKLFKSLVCNTFDYNKLFNPADKYDEYNIIGTMNREILTSFNNSYVILSYLRIATDNETGYPLMIDDSNYLNAVVYYVKWKLAETMVWKGKDSYNNLMQYAYNQWLKYAKQAKNTAKMPKTIDEWQNILENQYNMIPDIGEYYKGFNNISKRQIWNKQSTY